MRNAKRKTNRKIKQAIKNYDCSDCFNVNFISISAENIMYINILCLSHTRCACMSSSVWLFVIKVQ